MFNDFDKIIAKFQKDAETLITELKETAEELEKQLTEYKRWRAKSVGTYYFLAHNGSPRDCTDSKAPIDNYLYNTGNYFQTEQQAKQHRAYLLALQTIKDDAEGFAPDWRSDKYYGYYDHEANELNIGWSLAFQYQGVVYFKSEEAIEASQKEHRKEWLIVLGVE